MCIQGDYSTNEKYRTKSSNVSEVRSIILVMEAVRTSEMWVNFIVTTRRHIPEDSKLQTTY
jgi:hypothetical protein